MHQFGQNDHQQKCCNMTGHLEHAPLIKKEPVDMEVQQLNENFDKTCVIYDDDLGTLRLLAGSQLERTSTDHGCAFAAGFAAAKRTCHVVRSRFLSRGPTP